ncbi:MAG: hypothetical protein GX854_02290, partial [Clostridiales bacterium]|nr:hypothetical protein [Clostridiales bacterium]
MDFNAVYQTKVDYLQSGLTTLIKNRSGHPTLLKAIEYSLHSGGKRLLPVLFLSAYELACHNNTNNNIRIRDNAVLAMACALEMIHT